MSVETYVYITYNLTLLNYQLSASELSFEKYGERKVDRERKVTQFFKTRRPADGRGASAVFDLFILSSSHPWHFARLVALIQTWVMVINGVVKYHLAISDFRRLWPFRKVSDTGHTLSCYRDIFKHRFSIGDINSPIKFQLFITTNHPLRKITNEN